MGKKILVVDDDPDIREVSINVLEENGYSPIEAEDGLEGMNKIKKEKPDLLILDVMMPKQTGVRLFREVKADSSLKKLPVIIVSGVSQNAFLRSQKVLTEFGGEEVPEPDAYLEKPIDPETLAETVKKVLG